MVVWVIQVVPRQAVYTATRGYAAVAPLITVGTRVHLTESSSGAHTHTQVRVKCEWRGAGALFRGIDSHCRVDARALVLAIKRH